LSVCFFFETTARKRTSPPIQQGCREESFIIGCCVVWKTAPGIAEEEEEQEAEEATGWDSTEFNGPAGF
jgi:hypothetical protein